MSQFHQAVQERMLRYAMIDSQSGTVSGLGPSTACQRNMAEELSSEMKRIGVSEVFYDEPACIVYGRIPASPGVCAEPLDRKSVV